MEHSYQTYAEEYAQLFTQGMKPDEIERRLRPNNRSRDDAPDDQQGFHERARLNIITGEELLEKRFKRQNFIIDTLLKPGLAVLAGSPKIGKSWMVLSMCLQITRGETFWGMQTEKGDVLYIALEDTERRLRERLLSITDECPPELCITTECHPIGDQLEEELTDFCVARPFTRLVVIDTFQKIRAGGRELSYSNDYSEVSWLKHIADHLGVCILLVHHTRKLADNDTFNEISGTNGIAGSADTLMVLKKEKRSQRKATLTCTGRDIEDRRIDLEFDRTSCIWEMRSDSLEPELTALPEEMEQLIVYMKRLRNFAGTNTDFCSGYNAFCGRQFTPRALKQVMNRWRQQLLDRGVDYVSVKSDNKRLLQIVYSEESDLMLKEDQRDRPDTQKQETPEDQPTIQERSEIPSPQPLNATPEQPANDDPLDGSLNRDDDYMESLLNDDMYIPRTSMSEIDLEEEQSLWDAL